MVNFLDKVICCKQTSKLYCRLCYILTSWIFASHCLTSSIVCELEEPHLIRVFSSCRGSCGDFPRAFYSNLEILLWNLRESEPLQHCGGASRRPSRHLSRTQGSQRQDNGVCSFVLFLVLACSVIFEGRACVLREIKTNTKKKNALSTRGCTFWHTEHGMYDVHYIGARAFQDSVVALHISCAFCCGLVQDIWRLQSDFSEPVLQRTSIRNLLRHTYL